MTEIHELIKAIKEHDSDPELWTVNHIAEYLHRENRVVSDKIVNLPGFPQAIRLPTKSGGRGYPLWKSEEVKAWVSKHQEKRVA